MLEIRNVTKTYKSKSGTSVKALDNISITFPESGMVFVLGKSGCGKSTLLNVIGGLDSCDSGEFIIKGKSSKQFAQSDFDAYRNTFVGFIFQEYNILDDFSVGANIGLALELQGKKADSAQISAILGEVGLLDYAKRKPNELSGGQKQRIAIARALVKDPEIIMADEPTGALDSGTGKQILETLKELSRRKLVIVVSHDREFAERYGDRIIEMKDGQIISDVTKHEVEATALSAGILQMNDSLLRIEKGYQLTVEDLELINRYLREHDTDVLLSGDGRVNESVRAAAGITEQGTSSVFRGTEEKDVKKKTYGKEDSRFIRSRLPMKNALKIGASSLGHKTVRLVATILLSMIAFSLFGFADTMGAYNKYRTTVQSILDSHVDAASFTLGVQHSYTYADGSSYSYYSDAALNKDDIAYLNETLGMDFLPVYNGSQYADSSISLSGMMQSSTSIGGAYSGELYGFVAPSAAQLSTMGFEITGKLPSAENEIAITQLVFEQFRANGFRDRSTDTEIAPGKLTADPSGSDPNSIIGKHLTFSINGLEAVYCITAVIDTRFDYDRYADFIPGADGNMGMDDDFGILDMVMQEELYSTLRYGFHALCFLSEAGLQSLITRTPIYNYISLGTSMNWNAYVKADCSDLDMEDLHLLWLNRVAGSDTLSSLEISWIDGTPRSVLGENEIVIGEQILGHLLQSVNLREQLIAKVKDACGTYWKADYNNWIPFDILYEVIALESIDASFAEHSAAVRLLLFGEEPVSDETLKQRWFENFDFVSSSLSLPTRSALFAAKASPLLSEMLGREVPATYSLDLYSTLFWMLSEEMSSYSVTMMLIRLYAYDAVYAGGESFYGTNAFYDAALADRFGDRDHWNRLSAEERREIAASAYAEYIMCGDPNTNALGGKTFVDFADEAFACLLALSDSDLADLLSNTYISTASYWDENDVTEYRDFKVVGLYSTASYPHEDLIISDTLFAIHEEFMLTEGYGKEEIYPHAMGTYAFALAPMPMDEDSVSKLVSLTYDETGGLKFSLKNQVMNTLGYFNEFIEIGAQIFFWIGVGFAVFSSLMLMNFISISISYKRREIGILRAVGARSSDVFKIFFSEAFLIAFINYLLSLTVTVTGITVFNSYVRSEGLNVTLLSFGARQIVLMLAVSILTAAIASFLPVYHIAKRKPVDAIKNR